MRAPAKVVMIALFGVALAMTACSSDYEGDLVGDSRQSKVHVGGQRRALQLADLFGIDIEPPDPEAGLRKLTHEREADIAEADHPDA